MTEKGFIEQIGLLIHRADDLVYSLGVLAFGLLIGVVFYFIIGSIVARWGARRKQSPRDVGLNVGRWKAPLRVLIPGVGVAATQPLMHFPLPQMDSLQHAVIVWIIGAFTWFLIRTVEMATALAVARCQAETKDSLRVRRLQTQLQVVQQVLNILIVVVAAAVILITFPKVKQIGVSLLASAGVIGIIIGFAAQRTLGNLFAGMQIAIAQPIRLEDGVVVEGEFGTIEEITLTYVVVKLWDLRRLIVPISYFIEKPFQNWTRTSTQLLGVVSIHADYSVPVELVRGEFRRILEADPLWDRRAGELDVVEADECTIELRALVSAADGGDLWKLRCRIREQLIAFLQEQHPRCLPRTRIELAGIKESS